MSVLTEQLSEAPARPQNSLRAEVDSHARAVTKGVTWRAVGTAVFVAETRGDLEVAVET